MWAGETCKKGVLNMQRLKEHLKEAYKSFQDAKMETEHDPQNYTCLQIAEACYITLEKACYDVGVTLTKEEKEEIKKPLIEKWQKIMEKDKEEWEIKEKFFNENVVPRVKSYGEDIEKAETSAEVKQLTSDLYTFLRESAHFLGIKPNELEDRLSDIL